MKARITTETLKRESSRLQLRVARGAAMANSISVPREGHWSLGANVLFYLLIVAILSISTATAAEPKWQTLPDTPELPETTQKGFVTVDGARIWYAAYG